MITSTANQKVKKVIQLNQKSGARKKEAAYIVEGIKMFLEAPDEDLIQIYIGENFLSTMAGKEKQADLVRKKLERCGYETVEEGVFSKMADTLSPQGILCILKQKQYSIESFFQKEQDPMLLFLEDIQDPGNLGTIIRTAEGAGVCGILMTSGTVDIYNPKTIRSTMGSIYRVPFIYTNEPESTIKELKKRRIQLYAAHLDALADYDELIYESGSCFLIGNEARGLSEKMASSADCYVKIPMAGEVESLNAAIAAGLLVYEAAKQRKRGTRL